MSLPDYKALKKLADTCRKAGITHFKSAEFEFTLTDSLPEPARKSTKKATASESPISEGLFETDSLTEEQLLFYSVNDAAESTESKQ